MLFCKLNQVESSLKKLLKIKSILINNAHRKEDLYLWCYNFNWLRCRYITRFLNGIRR